MGTNKKNKNILDRMDSVELELMQNDTEYAKQFLKEEGFDIQDEQSYGNQYMKKIKFIAAAVANKQQDIKLFERAYSRVKKAIQENAQKTNDVLISLLHSKTPSVHYRKLENWSDDEIREVLADVDLIKLMEELDNK
jgi:predicted phosphohydrolase